MAAYMTAAKQAEIKSKYRPTMGNEAIDLLVDELTALEAALAAGGGIDWAEVAEIADVGATEAEGTSTEFARGDHVHALGSVVHNLTEAVASITAAAPDFIPFSDESEAGDPTRRESLFDILTAAAGSGLTQNATTGALEANVHGLTEEVAVITAAGTDYIAFSDESAAGDPTKRESLFDLLTAATGTGLTQNGTSGAIELGTAAKKITISESDLRKVGAWKDALPDAPDNTNLGVADTPGSLVISSTTNNTSKSEKAGFVVVLPESYYPAGALNLNFRGQLSAVRQVGATIDAVAKKISDGSLGADLVTTAATPMTTGGWSDHMFAVDATSLTAGDRLWVELTVATDDTAGNTDGHGEVSKIWASAICYN